MNDSYVNISATIALRKAQTKLAWIKATRDKDWQQRIHLLQATRGRDRFWMPWLKPLTELDARKIIIRNCVTGPSTPDAFAWKQEERCRRVVQLAKAASEHGTELVLLSSDDLEQIL
jgi:hypothetical protein